MRRQQLVSYMGLVLTVDTVQALKHLQDRAHEVGGWQVKITGPTPGTRDKDLLSLVPAGREVQMTFEREGSSYEESLYALWGCAVPLGFTPWMRYPVARDDLEVIDSMTFHFYGEWAMVLDRLLAEGRGHLAWPSLCCAAQVDVGVWQGDHPVERFVQAQLHRVGAGCGPVDGVVSARTLSVLATLGVTQPELDKAAVLLASRSTPTAPPQERLKGHVAMPGCPLTLHAFGGVKAVRTPQGATLTVDGPGRVVMDIGDTGQ